MSSSLRVSVLVRLTSPFSTLHLHENHYHSWRLTCIFLPCTDDLFLDVQKTNRLYSGWKVQSMNDERLGIDPWRISSIIFNWTLTAEELCRTVYMHRHYIRHTYSSLSLYVLNTPLSWWSGGLLSLVPAATHWIRTYSFTTGGKKRDVNSLGAFLRTEKQTA